MLGTNAGSMLTSNQHVNQNHTLQTGVQTYVPRNDANVDTCIYMLATTSSDEYGLLMYVQCCKLLQIVLVIHAKQHQRRHSQRCVVAPPLKQN